jgi:hypothetical protein
MAESTPQAIPAGPRRPALLLAAGIVLGKSILCRKLADQLRYNFVKLPWWPISGKALRLRNDAVPDPVQDEFGRIGQVKLLKDMRAVGLAAGPCDSSRRCLSS